MREGLFPSDPPAIDRLIGQVESLTRIVDDLRIVSLAQAGELRVTPLEIDLAAQVGAILDVIEPGLVAQGMAVERLLRPASAWIDPDRLRQAVLALLNNVAQHAAGGRSVTVETCMMNGTATLRVCDRGPGLPGPALQRIFEPFWRSDMSRSRRLLAAAGSVCRWLQRLHRLTEDMQGRRHDRAVGRSSRFRLSRRAQSTRPLPSLHRLSTQAADTPVTERRWQWPPRNR